MNKIWIEKDNKKIQVGERAAKLLEKTGWMKVTDEPRIIKEKKKAEPPIEVKELIVSKKEPAAVNDEAASKEPIETKPKATKPKAKKQ